MDRGRGMAHPIFGAGVGRSFPWRKSQRTRRLAPRTMLGAARCSIMERENLLSYTTRKKGANGDADYRFFLKYFFMASIPRKTE